MYLWEVDEPLLTPSHEAWRVQSSDITVGINIVLPEVTASFQNVCSFFGT